MRVKRGVVTKRRHNKVLSLAKGYRWGRKNVFKLAKNAVMKAGINAYRDRRRKKRDFRRLWITRISAALQGMQKRYSEFMLKMTEKKIILNRKVLADIAAREPQAFAKIVEKAYE
jgi:large subunit ribosomal protein L20